ncbi:LacI family DNA-binding transcriptional regulator [Microbacterium jejuense]|uniref:LacI family DNA-binding transcriptional regulator n=1 Tax=Microbacterium jejuense TaxID=1263637 RepID=UPI0031F06878
MAEARLSDVARAAGVSQSTASRVLNGSTRSVRAENAARVRAAAANLGYSVDLRAQATARGLSSTVAIVVDALTDPDAMRVAACVQRAVDDIGLLAQVTVCPPASDRAAEIVRILRGQRPRAIVLVPSSGRPRGPVADELAQFAAHGGLPVVLDRGSAADSRDAVLSDFVRLISAAETAA